MGKVGIQDDESSFLFLDKRIVCYDVCRIEIVQ